VLFPLVFVDSIDHHQGVAKMRSDVEEFVSNSSNHSMPVPPMMDYYSRPEQKQSDNEKEAAAVDESVLYASSSSAHLSDGHFADDTTTTITTTTMVLQERQRNQALERAEIEALARRETRQLRAWRLILLLVMLATGAMVATGTYLYIRDKEKGDRLASVRLYIRWQWWLLLLLLFGGIVAFVDLSLLTRARCDLCV
jgi:hypothetical protein